MQRHTHVLQSGFTLVELVLVISILGIIAAMAFPRFANSGSDARKSVLTTIQGAAMAGANVAYTKALLSGVSVTAPASGPNPPSIALDGITVWLAYGYPASGSINLTMQDQGGAVFTNNSSIGVWTLRTNCSLTYTPAAMAGAIPSFTQVTSGC